MERNVVLGQQPLVGRELCVTTLRTAARETMAAQTQKDVSFPTIVNLNVGGQIYTTSLSTLTKYSESMLGAMFSGRFPAQQDPNGNYFIDRDGALFRYVLGFLRNGELHVPENFHELDLLLKEAEFFQIPALIQTVKQQTKTEGRPEKAETQGKTREKITVFGQQHSVAEYILKSVSGRIRTLTEMFHIGSGGDEQFEIAPYDDQPSRSDDERTGKMTKKKGQKNTPCTDVILKVAQAHGFKFIIQPCVRFDGTSPLGDTCWVLSRPVLCDNQ